MKREFFACVVTAPLLLLGACATSINKVNADRYYELALQAEANRNWAEARQAYSRALVNARLGGAQVGYVSAVTYNLGRMVGYACDYDEAERLLLEALSLEEKVAPANAANLTKRWSELARLNFDQGKYKLSADWYAKAIPELERVGVLASDPIGFARYIEDYADALDKTNDLSANAWRKRASELRNSNPTKSANFLPTYYRDLCGNRLRS